jgi:hypothetical protein
MPRRLTAQQALPPAAADQLALEFDAFGTFRYLLFDHLWSSSRLGFGRRALVEDDITD